MNSEDNLSLAGNNDEDSDQEVIESMELLEGNYQMIRQWVPPAPNYWDAPPKAVIKSAEVRTEVKPSIIKNKRCEHLSRQLSSEKIKTQHEMKTITKSTKQATKPTYQPTNQTIQYSKIS
ncbi:hypothetical protein GQX74_005203 [Glossina fuscipes]|uniref:Uncharacterized protein n=1 Tax=Glossina palpalis gambiensis TaxID=67801 RepID=A0A1B0C4C1_9MUSC|nr:hypothetical protein GQX74_005203 [Glossina fuscipes]